MVEQQRSKLISGALILSGLEGLAVLVILVLTKSTEGGVFFGLSLSRLALAAGDLVLSLLLLTLGITWLRCGKLSTRLRAFLENRSQLAAFLLTWGFTAAFILQREPFFQILVRPFKPFYTIEYYQRFQLLLIWLVLIFLQISIAVIYTCWARLREFPARELPFFPWLLISIAQLFNGKKRSKEQRNLTTLWQSHKTSLLIFLGMILLWILIVITGIGIVPDDRFWNIAGVPVLWHQVILTLLLILLILDLKQILAGTRLDAFSRKPAFSYLLVALIWLTAVLVWQGEDLLHTYFSINTPPNFVFYPFSDAMRFDIGGQYFLMGKGLNNNLLTDRPFQMLHTAFLHILGGQDYDTMAFFQILLLALIPSVIFLIGSKMHSKAIGIAAALMVVIKEKNAIASAFKAGLANPKVLTSELPNALLLVLVSLCLLNWLRDGRKNLLWPVLAGGLTGLAIGVRGNSLTIIPLVLLLVLIVSLRQPRHIKQWALTAVLFLMSASAVLIPYSIKTTQEYGAPFWLIKVQDVIDRSELSSTPIYTANRLSRPAPEPSPDGYAMLTVRHFLHNEITTVLMLPLRWQANPLRSILEHPIWESSPNWDGSLTAGEKLALGANLLILAFGIGSAFKRWRVVGLVPLAIHLTYNLTNATARTSGGRYLVPTDWALLLYFALGLGVLIYALRGWEAVPPRPQPRQTGRPWLTALSLAGFLLIGNAYLLSGLITQPYDLNSPQARRTYLLEAQDQIKDAGVDFEEMMRFIRTDGSVFIGKALYPRYYEIGEPVPPSSYLPEIPSEEAHLYFLMLGNEAFRHVSIPLADETIPSEFPHGAYGLIIGCIKEDYTEGLIFIPLDAPQYQVLTQADMTLSCD